MNPQEKKISTIKIAAGDDKEFTKLVNSKTESLLLFACGLVNNREVAEEIINDVFVHIWSSKEKLVSVKNIESYIFISVKNRCLNYLNSNSNIKYENLDDIESFYSIPISGPESNVINSEVLEAVNKAIENLPPKCRMVFTMAKVNGLKYKDISEITNISVKTINNHIAKAIEKICTELEYNKKRDRKQSMKILSLLFV